MDSVSKAKRSEIMSRVRSRDTGPEMTVRRLVHSMGFRYRLHVKDLPGRPDLVFPRLAKIIQVHGCFWHRHSDCSLARLPKSRKEFWLPKLEVNRLRDQKNEVELKRLGWKILTVWECELGDVEELGKRLRGFLREKR